jgi:peptidoglycan/LPS O-acetylase OafA/YrhL
VNVPTVGGLFLAGGLVAAYIAGRATSRREWPDIGDIVLIVATSTALVAGVRLVVVAIISASLGPFRPEDRLFIPVAGLALILVSGKEIVEVIADRAVNRGP